MTAVLDDPVALGRMALRMPDDFFTDDERIGTTHALTFGVTRDSDARERTNYETIRADLTSRFADDVYVHGASHWASGWIDQLAVRVFTDQTQTTVTEAFTAALAWRQTLAEHAVLDDAAHSAAEWEEFTDTLEHWDGVTAENLDAVAQVLFDDYSICRAGEISDRAVADALAQLGADCDEELSHDAEGGPKARLLISQRRTYGDITVTEHKALCPLCAAEAVAEGAEVVTDYREAQ